MRFHAFYGQRAGIAIVVLGIHMEGGLLSTHSSIFLINVMQFQVSRSCHAYIAHFSAMVAKVHINSIAWGPAAPSILVSDATSCVRSRHVPLEDLHTTDVPLRQASLAAASIQRHTPYYARKSGVHNTRPPMRAIRTMDTLPAPGASVFDRLSDAAVSNQESYARGVHVSRRSATPLAFQMPVGCTYSGDINDDDAGSTNWTTAVHCSGAGLTAMPPLPLDAVHL